MPSFKYIKRLEFEYSGCIYGRNIWRVYDDGDMPSKKFRKFYMVEVLKEFE